MHIFTQQTHSGFKKLTLHLPTMSHLVWAGQISTCSATALRLCHKVHFIGLYMYVRIEKTPPQVRGSV